MIVAPLVAIKKPGGSGRSGFTILQVDNTVENYENPGGPVIGSAWRRARVQLLIMYNTDISHDYVK